MVGLFGAPKNWAQENASKLKVTQKNLKNKKTNVHIACHSSLVNKRDWQDIAY